MEMHWVVDGDGDSELKVDGQHFGVVCPHHDGYCKVAWDWGQKVNSAPTLAEAQRTLERTARAVRATEIAYNAAMEKEHGRL